MRTLKLLMILLALYGLPLALAGWLMWAGMRECMADGTAWWACWMMLT